MNLISAKTHIRSLFVRYSFVILSLPIVAVGCSSSAPSAETATESSGSTADTTPPSTPGSFTATAISTSQINLTWLAATDAVTPQNNLIYEICQSTTAAVCNTFSTTHTPAAGATSFNITGLSTATTFYFVLRVRDSAGNQRTTSEISADTQTVGTVNTPTFGTAAGTYGATQNVTLATGTAGATICYLTSGANPACNAAKTGCSAGTLYTTAVAIASSQTLKAVACLATYTDSSINSATYVIDTTIPSTPTSFTATTFSSSQVNLNWIASTDNVTSQPNIVYDICQTNTGGGCTTFTATYTTTAGATTYSVTGLNPVTTYYFVVRARDVAGNRSNGATQAGATTSTLGTIATPTYSPAAGTYGTAQNVTITTATAGSILCYTTNGANPTCDAPKTGCSIGTLYATPVAIGASLSLKARGCQATYTDSAINTGAYVIDTGVPTAPTAMTTTVVSTTSLTVSWAASTDTVTPQAGLVYDICQSSSAGGCNTFSATYTTAAGVVTHNVTGLTAGNRYYFRVRARDASGNNSAPSAEFFGTIPTENTGAKQWTRLLGVSTKNTFGYATTTDSSGNVYVAGTTTGNLDGQTLTGGGDAFITKYNASGVKQWTLLLGAAGASTSVSAIAIDKTGYLWVGGATRGTVSGLTCVNPTNGCLMLAQAHSNGLAGFQALSVMGVAAGGTYINGIAIDGSDNVYVAGPGRGDLDGQTKTGTEDGFIIKYNNLGVKQWTRLFGVATKLTTALAIASDASGNTYTTGYTQGALNGQPLLGPDDLYIIKYDTSGTVVWTRLFGLTAGYARGNGIALDSANNVYVTGEAQANMDGNTLTGTTDMFVTKYNSAGTRQWTRMSGVAGTNLYTKATGVATDSLGNVFITGNTKGALDGQTLNGTDDVFVMKYNAAGTKQWTRLSGGIGASNPYAHGVAVDSYGNVYATGQTQIGFDGQTLTGTVDFFLLKYQ